MNPPCRNPEYLVHPHGTIYNFFFDQNLFPCYLPNLDIFPYSQLELIEKFLMSQFSTLVMLASFFLCFYFTTYILYKKCKLNKSLYKFWGLNAGILFCSFLITYDLNFKVSPPIDLETFIDVFLPYIFSILLLWFFIYFLLSIFFKIE